MKATIDGTVVADAPESDLITIEGNYYFPPASLSAGALSDSPTPYTCPWKGVAQYHDVTAGGSVHHDAAWSYPEPLPERADITGLICFFRERVDAITVGDEATAAPDTPWSVLAEADHP